MIGFAGMGRIVAASLFTREQKMGLEELPFDMLIDESHGLDFDVSDHAVENGVTISDNIVQRLRQVTITGLFTNHSIGGKANSIVEVARMADDGTYENGTPNTAMTRWEKLKGIAQEKKTVHLITSLEDYPALVITHLSAQRGPADGEAIKFTMRLREIRTASVKKSTVTGVWSEPDTSTPEGRNTAPETNAGSQAAKDASKKYTDTIVKGNVQQKAGGN